MDRRLEMTMAARSVILVAVALTAVRDPLQASQKGPVWYWFETCGGPTLKLEVRLDKAIIYKSSFPLCHAYRSSTEGRGASKTLSFTFRPPRTIVWSGYRDESETSPANQLIECAVWLAGSEPDALLLGVSFMTSQAIYMNSIHIARPTHRDETEMAPGLVVVTHPFKHQGRKGP